ncbi:MAG: hypothetical protein BWY74_01627 [Firmicutes bacterium ADurb.Bin419]|nr:MAG: hypothetical protein BWY74_01627 [Firmicutes bacterium ADurb.Bin419]
MRIAEICPSCATYINASCILYDGDYLSNIPASTLDSLETILGAINTAIAPASGTGVPTGVPAFLGQLYLQTVGPYLYVGLSTTEANWGLVGLLVTSTTTTTTTTP